MSEFETPSSDPLRGPPSPAKREKVYSRAVLLFLESIIRSALLIAVIFERQELA
jgi:hypothetical protein